MYHKLTIEETLSALDVNPEIGLTDKEASSRVAKDENKNDGSSFWKFAGRAMARPVVILLIIAAALSAVFGGWLESLLILAVIIVHAVFSAECKRRGEKTLDRSTSASVTHAIVLRNGAKMKLPSDELVVGDVVTLKPGRVVPADLRLISSEGLVVDERALTGIVRAEKDCNLLNTKDVGINMRANCAFEGTVVIEGRGDGVVISTGMSTEMSRLTLPLDVPEKDASPTFTAIEKLTKKQTMATVICCVVAFIIAFIRDAGLLASVLVSCALAVAIIPESLGTAALTALSNGAVKLKSMGFLPKSMGAVEALGDVTVFTTDIPKMGVAATYTNGRVHTPQEEDTLPFIEGLLLCELGNQTLRSYASHKCDAENVIASFPKIGEYRGEVTTTLHRAGETTISYTGGKAEDILSRSSLMWDFGHIRPITSYDRDEIAACIRSFSEEGYSITALGLRSGDDVPCDSELIFLGIAATQAAEGIPSTLDTEKLRRAGINVYLLTESDAQKAKLGAAALSLPNENIITARELSAMDGLDLNKALDETFVFAGLGAQDKVRIIKTMKSRGEVVATIGEGISDAPALDASDIGLSDIHAKDAAKDASDVIFDSTLSADCAILRGKAIGGNIKKALTYLTAANVAELLCVFLSVIFGSTFALTPLQILLVNLITDILPVLFLTRGSSFCKKGHISFAYAAGALLGVLALVLFKLLEVHIGTDLAQWATFGALTLGELLLAIPIHFAGRDGNGKGN